MFPLNSEHHFKAAAYIKSGSAAFSRAYMCIHVPITRPVNIELRGSSEQLQLQRLHIGPKVSCRWAFEPASEIRPKLFTEPGENGRTEANKRWKATCSKAAFYRERDPFLTARRALLPLRHRCHLFTGGPISAELWMTASLWGSFSFFETIFTRLCLQRSSALPDIPRAPRAPLPPPRGLQNTDLHLLHYLWSQRGARLPGWLY